MSSKYENHPYSVDRRGFLKFTGLAAGSALLKPGPAFSGMLTPADVLGPYHIPETLQAPAIAYPQGKSAFLNWKTFAVPAVSDQTALLSWSPGSLPATDMVLRISVALDMRENQKVAVFIPGGKALGEMDIRFAANLQPFELKIPAADIAAIQSKGIGLRVIQGGALFAYHPTARIDGIDNHAFLPHLLDPRGLDPLNQFYARMLSRSSMQMFGWTEGCVLQGLWDLQRLFGKDRVQPILEVHLNAYVNKAGKLHYQSSGNNLETDSVHSIEWNLMFATYALAWPDHPVVTAGIDFMLARVNEIDTTEGCYTQAFPLALIGSQRKRADLHEHAFQALWRRRNHLASKPDTIYQRTGTFGNWARGVAWYMLGFSRAIPYLSEHPKVKDLVDEFNRCVAFVAKHQRDDGLWDCFLHNAASGRETSGSAGMAAAMAHAAAKGFGDPAGMDMARKTFKALIPHLRQDGILGGVAQNNKGGLALQNPTYRVLMPMAMGLMAQLASWVEPPPTLIAEKGGSSHTGLWMDQSRLYFSGPMGPEFEVELFSASGKNLKTLRLHSGKIQGSLLIDLQQTGLGPGMYLMKCRSLTGHHTLRRLVHLH